MARLIPQALYSRAVEDLHIIREHINAACMGILGYEPASSEDLNGVWGRASERITANDHDARESYAVLMQLKLEAGLLA